MPVETPKADFQQEIDRVLDEANERKLIMRIMGGQAVRIHCMQYSPLLARMGRFPKPDLDFISYARCRTDTSTMFTELGYEEDVYTKALGGGKRYTFHDRVNRRHADIFFDRLEMCHNIDFRGRLELDYPTISLVDLLLQKLQIVKLNEKDVIDVIVLLREHGVGEAGKESIDLRHMVDTCAKDWGWWKTVTTNLDKIRILVPKYDALEQHDKQDVSAKIDGLLTAVQNEPKSMAWKMRAAVGEKFPWWREIEELER